MKNIVIVGLGTMGSAISNILSEKKIGNVFGIEKEDDPNKKLEESDVIILAVKPQDFENFTKEIQAELSDKLVVSIMAGVSVKKIRDLLKIKKVVRVMPNLPLRVGKAFCGWFCSETVLDEEKAFVKEILVALGSEVEVKEEDQIDKITALSGSGPAYYFLMNQLLERKAKEMGFSDEQAQKISEGTFFGAAKLLENSPENSEEFIKKITSKGGTTEAALNYFQEKGLGEIFTEGIEKAYKRAKELGN